MVKDIRLLLDRFISIESLYLKFILTIIAVSLVFIAIELSNKNVYSTVDIIHGSIGIDGTVQVSGEVDTYEQNTVMGRKFNQ